VYLFIITVIFGLIYGALYPTFGNIQGKLGWSSTGQYDAEKVRNLDAIAPLYAAFAEMPHDQLAGDSGAMAVGERLFMNYCAQCHGSDARGSRSFPNLTDGDWLWGGDIDAIKASIAQGRMGVMPPMAAAVGDANQVNNLAHYVLSLSGTPHDSVKATLGKASFASCAACHGADGKGNTLMGAPNLTNNVWLHGWGIESVSRAINHGITNVMPAQNTLLTEQQIHVLASYVWGMSNKPTPGN
jgi:cytochrome c oxidase cbb3-type subunit 3